MPSIWKAFATGKPEDQEMAIDILGHIEGERPARALAGLAILGKTDVVRRAATESLARRDHMDVLMNWIGLLHDPVKYEVKQVAGPGMPGVLFVEGEEFKVRRFYTPPTAEQLAQSASELLPDGMLLPLKTDSPPPGLQSLEQGKSVSRTVWCFSNTTTSGRPKRRLRSIMTRQRRISSSRHRCCRREIDGEFQLQERAKSLPAHGAASSTTSTSSKPPMKQSGNGMPGWRRPCVAFPATTSERTGRRG